MRKQASRCRLIVARNEWLYDCPQLNMHCHGGHEEEDDEVAEEEVGTEEKGVDEEELVQGLLLAYSALSHGSTYITGVVQMSILTRFCGAI